MTDLCDSAVLLLGIQPQLHLPKSTATCYTFITSALLVSAKDCTECNSPTAGTDQIHHSAATRLNNRAGKTEPQVTELPFQRKPDTNMCNVPPS